MIVGFAEKRRRLAVLEAERAALLLDLGLAKGGHESAAAEGRPMQPTLAERYPRVGRTWTLILTELRTYNHFRANDIGRVSYGLLKEGKILRLVSKGAARAQLSHLTKKGVVKRMGGGNYRLSERTKSICNNERIGPEPLERLRSDNGR
jgi:hypothetical protein